MLHRLNKLLFKWFRTVIIVRRVPKTLNRKKKDRRGIGIKKYWAGKTPEQRRLEMQRRFQKRIENRKNSPKSIAQKAYWATKTREQRQEEMARRLQRKLEKQKWED
jgi:hypothetical protein